MGVDFVIIDVGYLVEIDVGLIFLRDGSISSDKES
jgi:hypothetical protein